MPPLPPWMIILVSILVGLVAILAVVVLQAGSRAAGVRFIAKSPWPGVARSQSLQRGYVVPMDARQAYAKIPVGAMSVSQRSFVNVFESVHGEDVAIFAQYEHGAPFPHPCRSCIVGFCRIPRGNPDMWVLGHRSLLSEPSIGGGTFHVPVAATDATVAVRVLIGEADGRVVSTAQLCFKAFADIGLPYDVILCDGWLIIPGPRPMYDDMQKYDLAEFVQRTLELARLLKGVTHIRD